MRAYFVLAISQRFRDCSFYIIYSSLNILVVLYYWIFLVVILYWRDWFEKLGSGRLLLELELSWSNWDFGLSSVVGFPKLQLSSSSLLWLDRLQLCIHVMLRLLTIRFLEASPCTFSWTLFLRLIIFDRILF